MSNRIESLTRLCNSLDSVLRTFPLCHLCVLGVHAGTRAKQASCTQVLEILGTSAKAASKARCAVKILRTLLQRSHVVDNDPCQRLRQIFELVSFLFPTSPRLRRIKFAMDAVDHSDHP